MRFLIDACTASHRLINWLRAEGHEVEEVHRALVRSDAEIMAQALHAGQVLMTDDKDFGELVFVQGLPHGPIIRFSELNLAGQVAGVAELLAHSADELTGPVLIVISPRGVRFRRRTK